MASSIYYPSIPKALSPPGVPLYTWDKIDGSSLFFEWTRKQGWCKQGTRERLFDATDTLVGGAIEVFQRTHAEALGKYAKDQRLDKFYAYVEFAGERSFAGMHHPEDEKRLYLFDASYGDGVFDPRDFLKLADKTGVQTPNYLGRVKWNKTFLDDVRAKTLAGITCEGVVGKVMERDRLRMWKTKTGEWRQMVLNKFETAVALRLIES